MRAGRAWPKLAAVAAAVVVAPRTGIEHAGTHGPASECQANWRKHTRTSEIVCCKTGRSGERRARGLAQIWTSTVAAGRIRSIGLGRRARDNLQHWAQREPASQPAKRVSERTNERANGCHSRQPLSAPALTGDPQPSLARRTPASGREEGSGFVRANSATQSISQSASQSVSQSANQPPSKPISQPGSHLMCAS